MPKQEICRVVESAALADGLFSLTMEAPAIAALAAPGQFVHIACGEGNLLRRPISICDFQGDRIRVVYQVKGDGTKWLSTRKAGDTLDMLGPLGRGFDLSHLGEKPVFVGGGIGVPPMLACMKKARSAGANPSAILGFRTRDLVILEQDFRDVGQTDIATDDGSYGTHGFVSDLLQAHSGDFTAVCCCGPRGMLKALADIAAAAGLPCQVSMEERMGCGVGACLVCACDMADGTRKHVCKDGPVFDAEEVDWNA
jgi:dihydroorotate dehydrogenase electron transfer subunit